MQIITQISEPGEHHKAEEIAVGIDFGTTNSLIAISENQGTVVIPDQSGNLMLPSIISFERKDSKTSLLIGQGKGDNSIRSIKRLLAKSTEEILANQNLAKLCHNLLGTISGVPRITFNSNDFNLPFLASQIFATLKARAEEYLKRPVIKAVVSVPAYFDNAARGQVLLAAKLAGFDVIRLIAEPTAAAFAYGLNNNASGCYLVYDFGGGTFDVSILHMSNGVFQVIATGGDNMLGGDDIDYLLASYIASNLKVTLDQDLGLKSKRLKEDLSVAPEASLEHGGKTVNMTLEEYNEIIAPLIDKTIKIARQVHFEAGEIALDGIILVGGTTRIRLITEKLRKSFNARILSDIDPDQAVAIGAAMQARNLSVRSNNLLIDVVPLSLGVELYGGLVEKIILRNTPIPFATKKQFSTGADNQTAMKFHILQGERELALDCRSLAHFELSGIPPMPAGRAKIEVNFAIDASGILSITATELTCGKSQNIEIQPTFGLGEKEISNMLADAYKHAGLDHENRLLLETKLEGQELINNLKKAILETPDILTSDEMDEINKSIISLQKVINLDNRADILSKIQYLNSIARSFIEKHLNLGAKVLLQGKKINDIGSETDEE